MDVTVIRATEKPEQLVCQAARGDYFDGYVGDTQYAELMDSVDYDEADIEAVKDYLHQRGAEMVKHHMADGHIENAAKTRSFIHKQLSRGHYGPWEHPSITFTVKGVSRVLMAQITRHRHMSFDVQSMRYVDFSDTEAVDPQSLLDPEHFSRETGITDLDEEDREEWLQEYRLQVGQAMDIYEDMIDDGVPKEDARFVLPLGTPVNMTFSGNARTMMHVLNLRQKASSQWEIRNLSNKIAEELENWMPYTGQWWNEHGPMKISP